MHIRVSFGLSHNHIHLFSMSLADLKPWSVHICNALSMYKNRCQTSRDQFDQKTGKPTKIQLKFNFLNRGTQIGLSWLTRLFSRLVDGLVGSLPLFSS
jgi:hypothetical protein